jgi:hypothetical protein
MKSPRFVVYHVASTMEKKAYFHRKPADELAASLGPDFAVATVQDYNTNVVHMVTRVNLMSGKEYQEPSNTPGYCSPASEAYWSM